MSNRPITEKVPLIPLPPVTERAQRMLDGMTFNRAAVASDLIALARECQMWREKYAADVAQAEPGSFAGAFDGIFQEIFKNDKKTT
jgi:hypothetical protein